MNTDGSIEDTTTQPLMNKNTGTVLSKLAVAEIYKDAIQKNLDKFKNRYNDKHPNNKISLELTDNRRIFDTANSDGFIAQAQVGVLIRENSLSRMLMNKVYNFRHKAHMEDLGEWKLTLYSEVLYELIGGCITLAILTNPENNIEYNGNKDQAAPGEQAGGDGDGGSNSPFEGGG